MTTPCLFLVLVLAAGPDPQGGVRPFEYQTGTVPFYPAGGPWGVAGDPIQKIQLPLEPDEAMRHYAVPDGFEARLFAAEPQLEGKPICMAWDERGRLWVAETVDYPNELQGGGRGRDRIRICEDADGDGRADRFTIFADRLSIPTSLAFSRGGVIVHQMPDTLFLKDTDGDDVADERRTLFSGWLTADTHAGPSNMVRGLDGWIYGMVGYSGFEGEVGGEHLSFRAGFYRFRSDGSKLEFLRAINNNCWGLGFSEEGALFGSATNRQPSVHMPIPNRFYEAVRGWSAAALPGIAGNPRIQPITDRIRQVDHHGGFTAAAGHALYTARAYPREYWNRAAFVCEPTAHLVAVFLVQPDGTGFASAPAWNLAASDDEWSAPIQAEVGPDGQVWVIDWYNLIIQHNPTPAGYKTGKGNAYETPRRDKKRGRIFRVVHRGSPPEQRRSLRLASLEQLLAALGSDNLFWRRQAQRLLVERGKKDVVPDLLRMASDDGVDAIGLNAGAIHALWTLQGLGDLDGPDAAALAVAVKALRHPSAGVRLNALRVLPPREDAAAAALASGALEDADGQVRLQALLLLAASPASPRVGERLAALAGGNAAWSDRWFADGLTAAAAGHDRYFLKGFLGMPPGDPAPELVKMLEIVSEHHARGAPSSIRDLIGAASGPASPRAAGAIVDGLARGWPAGKPLRPDASLDEALLAGLEALPAGSRGSLITLARRLGSAVLEKHAARISTALLAAARDAGQSEAGRLQAAAQLIDFNRRNAAAAMALLDLITPRTPPDLAAGLLEAAGRSEAPEAGGALEKRLAGWTPSLRHAAIRFLLSRADWTGALLDGLEDGGLRDSELSLDQKQRLVSHPNREIAARAGPILSRSGKLSGTDRQRVIDEKLPLAEIRGDPALGKAVFQEFCSRCHSHAGADAPAAAQRVEAHLPAALAAPGQRIAGEDGLPAAADAAEAPRVREKIGPDLTGMAVHPKAELLVHILDPSRSVEGNYRVYTVLLKNRRVFSGLLVSESKTAIEIVDVEGKTHALQRDEIQELSGSTLSLMPEGFENQLSRDALVNLLEFLTHRGRFLPIPIGKAATISSATGMFTHENAQVERLIFPDWSPRSFDGVPFQLIDPQDGQVPNAILLYGPQGKIPPRMPRSVTLPCRSPARAIHFLSGVSGWGFPGGKKGSVTMIVRLRYAGGGVEEHVWKNGQEFADYISRVDVPGSRFAFRLRQQQIRYLSIRPERREVIREIELVKGTDDTAPVVLAVTVEPPG